MSTTDSGFDGELSALEAAGANGDVLERARVVDRAAGLIDVFGREREPGVDRQIARLRLLRARLLPALERPEAAVEELTAVVTAHPGDPLGAEALLARARLLRSQGESRASEVDVSHLIEAFSGSDDAAASRFVVDAHLTRVEWAVAAATAASAAEAESESAVEAEESWMLVVRSAEALVAEADHRSPQLDLFVARGMSSTATAWRSITALRTASLREADEDVSAQGDEALHAGDVFFTRFAGTASPEIRALLAESELGLHELPALRDPAVALRVAERDLDLCEMWGGRPAAFFAEAALRRARALADAERQQEAHDQLRLVVEHGRDAHDLGVQDVVASAWEDLVRSLFHTHHGDAAILEAERFAAWLDRRGELAARVSARHALATALGITVTILASRIDSGELEVPSIGGSPVDPSAPARESVPLTPPEVAYAQAVGGFAGRFARDEDTGLRLAAARAMQDLAVHQRLRGHFEQAVTSYRDLVELFGDDPSPVIRDDVLGPSELNLGFLLLSLLARPADALAVYDIAITRIGEPQSGSARSLLGRLQSSRATALARLHDRREGNPDAARGDGADRDYRDPIGAAERERIRAAVERGRAASDAGDHVSAIAEYDSIIDAHPAPEDREQRQRVCDAMVRKGYSLGRLKQWSDSVGHHQELLALFGNDIDTTIEKDIALALANLADAFDHLDRHEEEIDAYEQILTRWSDSPIPELAGRCARAAWLKGFTEAELGRSADAERSYRRGMRYLSAEETATRVAACTSAVNLSIFLRRRSRPEEAASAAGQAIASLAGASGAPAAEQRTKAYLALARAEAESGDTEAALLRYDWLLNDRASVVTQDQRRALTQEHIQLLGGPFKGAWRRLRRGRAGG